MIENLLRQAVKNSDAISDELNAEDEGLPPSEWAVPVRFDPEQSVEQVSTLAKDIYRPVSPMLRARFQAFGRWRRATHGHWLSASDMAALWDEPADPLLREMREAAQENWPHEASALFRPERLSFRKSNEPAV